MVKTKWCETNKLIIPKLQVTLKFCFWEILKMWHRCLGFLSLKLAEPFSSKVFLVKEAILRLHSDNTFHSKPKYNALQVILLRIVLMLNAIVISLYSYYQRYHEHFECLPEENFLVSEGVCSEERIASHGVIHHLQV